MPPHHSHGCSCGDDDAHVLLEGVQDYLYDKVDRDHVVALNVEQGREGKCVIRTWDEREQEDQYLESEADDQLILHVPFTGSIKLKSILIKAGPQGWTPDKVKVFSNQTLDFDEATSTACTQEFDIAATRGVTEYAVKPAKFPSVSSLTLFFPASTGEDTVRIFFVGFKGEHKPFTRDPVITVYEAQANPADHLKLPGIGSNVHSSIG
ncbi:BQ2448_6736 [Microbotryum intermedium]|uniref:BQ2448_6736 protein n=1 Tax=Microbotryum intermedium TaxID=269621 RepID=A0A238FQZ4_9BASI|nr:BQ2448_6736 [Microbotryum intermedium]